MKTCKAGTCMLTSPTIRPSFEILHSSLRLVIEKRTHVRPCRVPANRNNPWHKAVNYIVIGAEKHTHMAQSQYLITSTSLNKQINKAKTNMVKIIHITKLEVYLAEINSATTKRVCLLLATVNAWTFIKFININTIVHLPAIFYDVYFYKFKLIRKNIDQHRQQTQNSTAIAQTSPKLRNFLSSYNLTTVYYDKKF